MKINRADTLYSNLDIVEDTAVLFQILTQMLTIRKSFYEHVEKIDDNYYDEYIKKCNGYTINGVDRDIYEIEHIKTIDMFAQESGIYIKDYAYYNISDLMAWVNIDFSLSKQELFSQISRLKDDFDKDKTAFFPNYKDNKNNTFSFSSLEPYDFSKSIKRNFADLIFIVDCTSLGYKQSEIINSVFNYRVDKNISATALTSDTIRKYIKKANEVLDTIEI